MLHCDKTMNFDGETSGDFQGQLTYIGYQRCGTVDRSRFSPCARNNLTTINNCSIPSHFRFNFTLRSQICFI